MVVTPYFYLKRAFQNFVKMTYIVVYADNQQ